MKQLDSYWAVFLLVLLLVPLLLVLLLLVLLLLVLLWHQNVGWYSRCQVDRKKHLQLEFLVEIVGVEQRQE